jgi:hypothetical protein
MVTAKEVAKITEKYGLSLSVYQDKFYLQPVSLVGDKIYLQTSCPTWKKNGREEVGKSKIVSFGLGSAQTARTILEKLLSMIPASGTGSPVPTPGEEMQDDLPF